MPRSASFAARFALPALLALTGCAVDVAPQQRGFFGALGAAASGTDNARDARLQADAAAAERRATEMQARLAAAQQQEATSAQRVAQAQARLRQIDTQIATLRQRAEAAARDGQTPEQRAEGERVRAAAEALERERRAAATAPGGPSDAAMESMRNRARALDDALTRNQRT